MARHSIVSLLLKIFGLACGFLYAVAAARLLGPSGYGVVSVAVAAATVVATVAVLGIDGLALRETAASFARNDWGELRRFVRWALLAVFGASTLAAALLAGVSMWSGIYGDALLLASVAVPLLGGLLLLRAIIQGTGNVVEAQVPGEVVRWLATLSLVGALFVLGTDSPTAVIAVVLAGLAAAFVASIAALRRIFAKVPMTAPSGRGQRHWILQASPFLTLALFGIVGTEISTLLLGWLAGPREAGLYQPIARLAPLMLLAAHSVETALAPRIVQRWEEADRAALQRLLRRSAVASTAATAAISGAILIASPWILAAFGEEFTRYQSYLYLIAAAQVVNASMGASPLLLSMVGNMRPRLQAQAVTLVVQSGLCIALIPSMGAAGAAISLTAAILVWSTLHWVLSWRATGIDTSSFGALRLLERNA